MIDKDNLEYLKSISVKAKDKAIEVLAIAKLQELEKKQNGYRFIPCGIRGMKLTNKL